MSKLKVIDLLNMISRGEEVPNKIKYCRTIFYYDDNSRDYISVSNEFNSGGISICKYIFGGDLNDEVEILEEEKKIPERLFNCCMHTDNEEIKFLIQNINDFADKWNELIDYLESKEKGE